VERGEEKRGMGGREWRGGAVCGMVAVQVTMEDKVCFAPVLRIASVYVTSVTTSQ